MSQEEDRCWMCGAELETEPRPPYRWSEREIGYCHSCRERMEKAQRVTFHVRLENQP